LRQPRKELLRKEPQAGPTEGSDNGEKTSAGFVSVRLEQFKIGVEWRKERGQVHKT